MKKTIALSLLLLVSQFSIAGNEPKLIKEIQKKSIFNLKHITLNKERKDFVLVKFKIEAGEVIIIDLEGTQSALIGRVQERLEKMQVKSSYDENKEYSLKFTFEAE